MSRLNSLFLPANILRYLSIKYPELSRSAALRRELDRPRRWKFPPDKSEKLAPKRLSQMSVELGVSVTFRYHRRVTSRDVIERIVKSAKSSGVKIQLKPARLKRLPSDVRCQVHVPPSVVEYLALRIKPSTTLARDLAEMLKRIENKTAPLRPRYPERVFLRGKGAKLVSFHYSRKIGSREALDLIEQCALKENIICETWKERQNPIWGDSEDVPTVKKPDVKTLAKKLARDQKWFTIWVPTSFEEYFKVRFKQEKVSTMSLARMLRGSLLHIENETAEVVPWPQKGKYKSKYWTPEKPFEIPCETRSKPVRIRFPRPIGSKEALRMIHSHALREGVRVHFVGMPKLIPF